MRPGPTTETIVNALVATSAGQAGGEAGIDELYVVFTRFINMGSQSAAAVLVAPVKSALDSDDGATVGDGATGGTDATTDDSTPSGGYEFEPEPDQLIGALLPRYISARIFSALLESAASESAARRRAMKSASDNATELIRTYTRLANQARQAEITQEISEIVGGADALASAGSDQR